MSQNETDEPMRFAVVHIDKTGWTKYYSGPDVTLILVDETGPDDRVYVTSAAMSDAELRALIGDSPIGHAGDGSPAATRAQAAKAYMEGRPHLAVVDTLDGEGDA